MKSPALSRKYPSVKYFALLVTYGNSKLSVAPYNERWVNLNVMYVNQFNIWKYEMNKITLTSYIKKKML